MLLFFSPVLNLLSESRKQSRLVFWGVELIPTPDANKSLQVSGDFHAQLLSYIKHYIDEAIAEMEASETAPQTEEIESPYSSETEIARLNEVVDKKATQSEPKTKGSSSEKIETDGVKSVETEPTPQKPEIVNTEAVEVVETDETDDDIENWPTPSVEATDNKSSELTTDEAIATLLECQTKLQLMSKKKDIGEELVQKAWDEMTLVQRNYLQLISLRENVTKSMGTLGYQLMYQPTKDSKPRKARLIGFYLYGDKLPLADERSILLDGETQPTVCSKAHLRPFKNSAKATEAEIKLLEKLLTEPQETEPTAETMANNTFTGLADIPKPQTGSETGNKPDSEQSKPNVGVQTELNLKTPQPEPPELPPTPTPALEAIVSELLAFHPQTNLSFTYETTPKSTFLIIKHGESKVACFEDNGSDIYEVGDSNLDFHGWTQKQVTEAYYKGEEYLESLKSKKA